jgi:hypothetical protein
MTEPAPTKRAVQAPIGSARLDLDVSFIEALHAAEKWEKSILCATTEEAVSGLRSLRNHLERVRPEIAEKLLKERGFHVADADAVLDIIREAFIRTFIRKNAAMLPAEEVSLLEPRNAALTPKRRR